MKILLIAEGHPREWPVLKSINSNFPSTIWLQPIYEQTNSSTVRNKIAGLVSNPSRLYFSIRTRIHKAITKRKIKPTSLNFEHHLEFPWHKIEQEKGQKLLDKLQPDLIITSRAPILTPVIFEKARLCALNVHFGINPFYRGNEGLFWALLNNDFEALGGSIHLIDSGIDTGGKLVDAFPELDGTESLIEIELAVSRVLAEALLLCLNKITELKSVPDLRTQDTIGRNYKLAERSWSKDLEYLLKRMRNSLPPQKKKIQFFF